MTNGTLHLGTLVLFIGMFVGAVLGSRGEHYNIWDKIASAICGLGVILMLAGLASELVWVGE